MKNNVFKVIILFLFSFVVINFAFGVGQLGLSEDDEYTVENTIAELTDKGCSQMPIEQCSQNPNCLLKASRKQKSKCIEKPSGDNIVTNRKNNPRAVPPPDSDETEEEVIEEGETGLCYDIHLDQCSLNRNCEIISSRKNPSRCVEKPITDPEKFRCSEFSAEECPKYPACKIISSRKQTAKCAEVSKPVPIIEPVRPPPPRDSGTVIRSIEPSSGTIGTEVTLTGENFDKKTEIHFGSNTIEVRPLSSSTLKFSVPKYHDCEGSCLFEDKKEILPDTYYVFTMKNGISSNRVKFTIIGKEIAKTICKDSDDGIEYNIRGNVKYTSSTGNAFTYEDQCFTEKNELTGEETYNLVEYYCKNGEVNKISSQCWNGCKEGECLKGEKPRKQAPKPLPLPPCKQKTAGCYSNDGRLAVQGSLTLDNFGHYSAQNTCIEGKEVKLETIHDSEEACNCITNSRYEDRKCIVSEETISCVGTNEECAEGEKI